jgi:Fe-Mn family superoxide dismutase
MAYEQKNYENLIGISGLSESLLKNHFTLYQGYVNNTNKLLETLKNLMKDGKMGTPEFSELKRRFGWEFNGMRLHEFYFENISKEAKLMDRNSAFSKKLIEDFESYENWEKEFKGIGGMRGIGWVMLCLDMRENKLINIWVNEHDVGHLSGTLPLLVMDVFEHAYMVDYGLKKADYIESFFKLIDWEEVNKRFMMSVR